MIQMRTYYSIKENEVTATNMVMGMEGQTHKHTLKEWETWKKEAEEMGIECINLDKLKQ